METTQDTTTNTTATTKGTAYKYIRFMRDGSVKEVTAVSRSRSQGKRQKKLKSS